MQLYNDYDTKYPDLILQILVGVSGGFVTGGFVTLGGSVTGGFATGGFVTKTGGNVTRLYGGFA